jgi:sugar/nucleoside kinase (ribokinase family)
MTNVDSTVLAVGSIAFDSLSTPSGKAERILGGSANYFSLSASAFTKVKLVGIVGEDFPEEHFKTLQSRGIDTSGIERAQGKTFHWVGEYGKDLNEAKTLSTQLNVFEHFNPKLPAGFEQTPYLFLANIMPELQLSVYEQMKRPRFVAADSMNFWIAGKRSELLKTLKIVDLLTINEGEAFLLSEKDNILEAAEAIRAMGPKVLVVKRGEYGALMFSPQGIFSAPALPLKQVKDPTGAGDTFAGGMIGYLAKRGVDGNLEKHETALREAIIYGSVMASFTVEDFGFSNLLRATPGRIEERFKQFMQMTRF